MTGRTDGRTNERMDGRTDGLAVNQPRSSFPPLVHLKFHLDSLYISPAAVTLQKGREREKENTHKHKKETKKARQRERARGGGEREVQGGSPVRGGAQ